MGAHGRSDATGTPAAVIDARSLETWAVAVLEHTGLSRDAASTVAAVLLHASLRGVDSHGIARLPDYVERLRTGAWNARPQPRLLSTRGAVAVIDGDNGPGAVAADVATDRVIELAQQHCAGVVLVRHSGHFGPASYYAIRIAEAGMIGMSMTNSEPLVIPFGGREPALGTNPIAFAAPLPDGRTWDLDMATSQVAVNRIRNARDEGQAIPLGWGVDAQGRDTTDPAAVHAAVPLGGYKGYGLALMVEVLCGVAAGAGVAGAVGDLYGEGPQNVGHFLVALDPDSTVGRPRFAAVLAGLLAQLRAVPPAAGADEVLVAGDPEARTRAEREQHGIPIGPGLWRRLQALGDQLEAPVPLPITRNAEARGR